MHAVFCVHLHQKITHNISEFIFINTRGTKILEDEIVDWKLSPQTVNLNNKPSGFIIWKLEVGVQVEAYYLGGSLFAQKIQIQKWIRCFWTFFLPNGCSF